MIKRSLHITLILFLVSSGTKMYAQSCEETLRKAQIAYDQGRLNEVAPTLDACLKAGFNDEEKVQAYRVLVLTYLLLNEAAMADEYMFELLKTDPEYIPDDNDPIKYRRLYETYRTDAVLAYGIMLGGNISQMQILTGAYGGGGSGDFTGVFRSNVRFQAGLSLEFPVQYNRQYIVVTPGFRQMAVTYFAQSNEVQGYSGEVFETVQGENITEVQVYNYLDLPVSWRYQPKFLDFEITKTYLMLSATPSYLLGVNFQRESEDGLSPLDNGDNITSIRNPYRLDFSVGAGQKFKIGLGYLFAQASFNYAALIANNTGFIPERQSSSFPIADPRAFKLHTVDVSIGYMFQYYKPKKLGSE